MSQENQTIPALFPDTLQDCCLGRILKHLGECGRAVEKRAKKDIEEEEEEELKRQHVRSRRRRSSLLRGDVSRCFMRTKSFELSNDELELEEAPCFFAESGIFQSGVATCRRHLTNYVSSHLQDMLMRAARRRPLSEQGTLFCFAVLCSERLNSLVACSKREEDNDNDDENTDEDAPQDEILVSTANWDKFLHSPLGGDTLLSCLVHLRGLSTLVLHQVCTDEMLLVVADTCRRLQRLDISHSKQVTHLGLLHLGGDKDNHKKPGCHFLREFKFNTSEAADPTTMPRVVASLLRSLPHLEVADLAHLHEGICHYFGGSSYRRRVVPPLNLIHYTGSDELSQVLHICPKLRSFKLFVTPSLPSLGATLDNLGHTLDEVCLVYSDQHSLSGLDEFLRACGKRITHLEIDCSSTETNISDLQSISSHCTFLDSLTITNLTLSSSLSAADLPPVPLHLPFLTSFRLIHARLPSRLGRDALRLLLGGCPEIERLYLSFHPSSSALYVSDFLLDELLSLNPLARLERFVARGRVSLTLISALRLISSRPKLRAIGRLLEWDVQEGELANFAGILRRANGMKLLQDISIF